MFILSVSQVHNNNSSGSTNSNNNTRHPDEQLKALFDTDLDGVLSPHDFTLLVHHLDNGIPLNPEQLAAIDTDGNGQIDDNETANAFMTAYGITIDANNQFHITTIPEGPGKLPGDIDGDRVRSYADLDAFLTGYSFSDLLTPGQMARLDRNQDGDLADDYMGLIGNFDHIRPLAGYALPDNATPEQIEQLNHIYDLVLGTNDLFNNQHDVDKNKKELYDAIETFTGKKLSGVSKRMINEVINSAIDANKDGVFDLNDILFVANKDNANKLEKQLESSEKLAEKIMKGKLDQKNIDELTKNLAELTGVATSPENTARLLEYLASLKNTSGKAGTDARYLMDVWTGRQRPEEDAMLQVRQLGSVAISAANGTEPPQSNDGTLIKALAVATGHKISDEAIERVRIFFEMVQNNDPHADRNHNGIINYEDLLAAFAGPPPNHA